MAGNTCSTNTCSTNTCSTNTCSASNDDTLELDDDSLLSLDTMFVDSSSFDWVEDDITCISEGSIFCEEPIDNSLSVEEDGECGDGCGCHGDGCGCQGDGCGCHGDGCGCHGDVEPGCQCDIGEHCKMWGMLGVLFLFLLARVGYSAWRLVQLHASVHNWTTDDVEFWLKDVVGLPQYLPIFKKNRVDGNFLPRLALNTDHLIQVQLGISDHNHKNKLILKAMDLVLFGPPTVFYNPLKDAFLALAILVAISGLFFSTVQRKKAQNQISKMIEEVDKLQVNEQKFLDIQSVLHSAEKKNETVVKEKQSLEKKLRTEINQAKSEAMRLCKEREVTKTEVERLTLAEQELEQVRLALYNAEAKHCQNSSLNKELQPYLKATYRKEREQYNIKKAAADKQLEEAKQWGLKMRKKRAGIVSSLKMIHGNSLEAVENRICSARTALIEATADLQELSSRWRRIESLCNFNITASDDAEFGSTLSLSGSDSNNSSPEPGLYNTRSNSSSSKSTSSTLGDRASKGQTQSLKNRDKPKVVSPKIHGSTPNLSGAMLSPSGTIPRNNSSNTVKDLAKVKNKINGHIDSLDSDDSTNSEKRGKGKNLWRLVRESRLNADQKWKDLIRQSEQI